MWYSDNEVVNLALIGSFLVPRAPWVTVGGDIEAKWWMQNTAGLFRSGHDHDGKDNFTPLYMLKGIRQQREKRWFNRRGENPYPEREGDDL